MRPDSDSNIEIVDFIPGEEISDVQVTKVVLGQQNNNITSHSSNMCSACIAPEKQFKFAKVEVIAIEDEPKIHVIEESCASQLPNLVDSDSIGCGA